MPDPRPLSDDELAAYLTRIGLMQECLAHNADTLARLQCAHMRAIPFENLDVQRGLVPSLDPSAIFTKLVEQRRGGWCFEQNGMFGRALMALGFTVMRVAGAVLREERGDLGLGTHLALLVTIGSAQWLADVGFGGGLPAPIALKPMRNDARPLPHSLDRTADGWWRVTVTLPSGPLPYDFETRPADEALLARACHWQATAPESVFVQSPVIQRRIDGEHRVLRGRTYTVSDAAETRSTALASAAEFAACIADRFDLDVPDADALWARTS